MMDVRPIRNEADYLWALAQIEPYFVREPEPGSPDGDRFDVLATLVEAYEHRHHALPAADPVDVLRFAIEDLGRSQADLARLIGRSRASEVLSRRRALTLDQIRLISEAWNLPVAALSGAYALVRDSA